MAKILDCTLRDGGYYTNWDFDSDLVHQYLESMDTLPVDYIEVGYRSKSLQGYYGKYFYSPIYELENIRLKSKKKLAIILNEKDTEVPALNQLLDPIQGIIDMVRIAIDPAFLGRAIQLAKVIKSKGFEVGFNVMYMSKWKEYPDFQEQLTFVDDVADYFYMVDSYGGVYPQDVIDTIALLRKYTNCPLGFHGHNNLELALINSLTAIEHGVAMVDSTVLGMGRGAGNLKTELFLTALNSSYNLNVDYNALAELVATFEPLQARYQWGTNLAYMISGSNSLPQKDVMDWVTTRFYSFNSIIQALQNKRARVEDNEQLPQFKPTGFIEEVLIIGGGKSAIDHSTGIIELLKAKENLIVIHASSKNAHAYRLVANDQIFCLVGNEGKRLERVFDDWEDFHGQCVLPPYPRKMGTYLPFCIRDKSFELETIEFTQQFRDSHTALALQTALSLGAKQIYIAGYDGYQELPTSSKELILTEENNSIFNSFINETGISVQSLTPSKYKMLIDKSVYNFI